MTHDPTAKDWPGPRGGTKGLSYTTADGVLVLIAGPRTTPDERNAVFAAIREDEQIPDGSPMIVDARAFEDHLSFDEMERRVRALVEALQPKLGWVCAMVVREEQDEELRYSQRAAEVIGMRMKLFHDVKSARRWLGPYIQKKG